MPEQDSTEPIDSSLYTEYGEPFALIFIARGKRAENVARFLQVFHCR
jgi:hypothetical protein